MVYLPTELWNEVIDRHQLDRGALSLCGAVCSQWLRHSRHHLFKQVQLDSTTMAAFSELASSPKCTFTSSTRLVQIRGTDATSLFPMNSGKHDAWRWTRHLHRAESLLLSELDLVAFPPPHRLLLVHHLAALTNVEHVELRNATFHDMRDVISILAAFPRLQHLTATITFLKHLPHAISSAISHPLPSSITSLELGTPDVVPVFLTSALNQNTILSLETLKLDHLMLRDVPRVCEALIAFSSTLRYLTLGFSLCTNSSGENQVSNLSEIASAEDPSSGQSDLDDARPSHGGQADSITFSALVVGALPSLLDTVITSVCNLERLDIRLDLTAWTECDVRVADWDSLKDALGQVRPPNFPRSLCVKVIVVGEEVSRAAVVADVFGSELGGGGSGVGSVFDVIRTFEL